MCLDLTMKRVGTAWNCDMAHITDIFDDTNACTFRRFGEAKKSPSGVVKFAGRNEFTAFIDGCINSAQVAQTGNICQSI